MYILTKRHLARKRQKAKSYICKNKPVNTPTYRVKSSTKRCRVMPLKISARRNIRVISSPSISHELNIERIKTELINQRKALSNMSPEDARIVAIKRLTAAGLMRK